MLTPLASFPQGDIVNRVLMTFARLEIGEQDTAPTVSKYRDLSRQPTCVAAQ